MLSLPFHVICVSDILCRVELKLKHFYGVWSDCFMRLCMQKCARLFFFFAQLLAAVAVAIACVVASSEHVRFTHFFSSLCCFTANPLTVAFLSPVQFRSPVASWRTLHSSAEQSVKRKNRPTNVVPCQTKFMFAHQRCRAKTKNRLLCKVDATRTRMRAKNDFTSSFVISLSLSHHR